VNFGPHLLALLEGTREVLQATQSMWAKVQKQKSYKWSNFENNSNFLEINELKCLKSRKRFGVLTQNFAHLLARPKSVSKLNFVGQSSETKKLLSDRILNFGPDFLETGELWST